MSDFPKIRVVGGPSPTNLEVSVDGEPIKKIFELDIHAGINEAISATIHQYVEIDVEVNGMLGQGYVAAVRMPEGEAGVIKAWREVARGTGKTLREAVLAAAMTIPIEAPH